VFLDDCEYQRTDSTTGAKESRHRKAGEVIWHNKGEDAPVLVNTGSATYRTLVIELKNLPSGTSAQVQRNVQRR